MADGDTKLRQDLGVPKYKASASLTQRKAEFEKWLRAVRPAIEKAALGFLSKRNLQLDASNGQSVTGWIYVSKLEQLARSDYPYYSDEFDERNLSIAGAKKDNSQWNLYYNWLQTTLFQVLLSSFGELDSSIFDTHDLHNTTLQQIELHPCSDSVRYEADRRIPYASLAFLELQAKYNSSLPTDALQLVMAYDLAKQSFSGNNLEAWTGSVLKQWNKLCSVKKYHDDEYLAVLQLLLTLQTKNGVWNEWAANYCTHFSDPKNFKVSAFMANVLEKLRLDTLAVQHRENGKAQAAAHFGFGGGGNGGHNGGNNGGKGNNGGTHGNDRHVGKGGNGGDSVTKTCAECQKKLTPHAQHYTRCVPCEQSRKANALVGSSAGGKSLLAKQHDKRKKSFAKGKKARAHSRSCQFRRRIDYASIVIWLCR